MLFKAFPSAPPPPLRAPSNELPSPSLVTKTQLYYSILYAIKG
jgi:hypothetical protein